MNGPWEATVPGAPAERDATVRADAERAGRYRHARSQSPQVPRRRRWLGAAALAGAACLVLATVYVFTAERPGSPGRAATSAPPFAPRGAASHAGGTALPTAPHSYIGLYSHDAPASYDGVTAFASSTGVKPDVVLYYSGWLEPFQAGFATLAAHNGAVPLVQMDPENVSVAAIASGRYDNYLRTYADAVRAYGRPVILSFGHEMNGYWYSWGYQHTSPAVFVSAWRHIVALFRTAQARNVTWLWTVNTIHKRANVPSPAPWWPGGSYVDWVGIDGYYFGSASVFSSLFGPTIATVRAFTGKPILIAETSAAPAADQAAKIADLFAGIRLYGLLGFVWFNSVHVEDWRLSSRAAVAAFRRGFEMYHDRPAS